LTSSGKKFLQNGHKAEQETFMTAIMLILIEHYPKNASRTLRRAGGRRLANRGSAAILGAFAAALAASALAG
jgi:hypothetical protein